MKPQILEKLETELRQKITERQAVYILVQLRKLIDEDKNGREKHSALNFYCDWAVHTHLDRKGAKRFIDEVEKYVAALLDLETGYVIYKQSDATKLISLDSFRQELGVFLTEQNLPTHLVSDEKQWHDFLLHYGGII